MLLQAPAALEELSTGSDSVGLKTENPEPDSHRAARREVAIAEQIVSLP